MWRNRKPRAANELSAKEIAALVKAAQVSDQEIRRWHADFLDEYPSGRLDKKTFTKYCHKLKQDKGTDDSIEKIFEMLDINNDGTVDFNELLVVIVLSSRLNDMESRLTFAFDTWDSSGDGQIDQTELSDVISAIYDHAGVTNRKGERDPKKRAKAIIDKLDINGDRKLNIDEFVTGCKNDPVICNLLAPNI